MNYGLGGGIAAHLDALEEPDPLDPSGSSPGRVGPGRKVLFVNKCINNKWIKTRA